MARRPNPFMQVPSVYSLLRQTRHAQDPRRLAIDVAFRDPQSQSISTAKTTLGRVSLLEVLEDIIAEAGDLIQSRSPELAAQARAALRRYADDAPRQAE